MSASEEMRGGTSLGKAAGVVWALTLAALGACVLLTWEELPGRVAYTFGAEGASSEYARADFLRFCAFIGALYNGVLLLARVSIGVVPVRLWDMFCGIPQTWMSYWMSTPQRMAILSGRLKAYLCCVGAAANAAFLLLYYMIYAANVPGAPGALRLESVATAYTLPMVCAVFSLPAGIALLWLMRPPRA